MSKSRTFEAQYEGTCPRCWEKIRAGDHVRYVDDELVHSHHEVKVTEYDICPSCHLARPCECD